MPDDPKTLSADILSRQYEMFAELTAKSLEYPINLVLTLNSGVLGAALFIFRGLAGESEAGMLFQELRGSFWYFACGIILVLFATFAQWRLYSRIMHRKQDALRQAIKAESVESALHYLVNEPEIFGKTIWHIVCFALTAGSYLAFLAGIYQLGQAFMSMQ
jgi:hypothetical protein